MMEITIKSEAKVICGNKDGLHRYFAWPSVARLQDHSLAMVASGFRIAHICPFGKVVLCRSYDEGKSWSAPEVIMDTLLDDRDAGICTFGKSGVMVTSFNNTVDFQRKYGVQNPYTKAYLDLAEQKADHEKYLGSTYTVSHDGGKTFGDIGTLPVSSPHGPCVLNDGSILYVGRIYDGKNDSESDHIRCCRITPDGKAEYISKIADVEGLLSCEPDALQLPDGKIIVHIRVERQGYFTTYQSESYDNAKNWTKPHRLLDIGGGAPSHLLLHSSGTLIAAYGYRQKPYGIRVMFSHDGGESWETDHVLYDAEPTGDTGYPCSVELNDGSILTVFYGRENNDTPGELPCSGIKQIIWGF